MEFFNLKDKEEEVRKSLLAYLITQKGYPQGLITKELPIKKRSTSRRDRRVDVLVFSVQNHTVLPLLLIECKRTKPTQAALLQLFGYNLSVRAPWSGLVWKDAFILFHYSQEVASGALADFPTYEALLSG